LTSRPQGFVALHTSLISVVKARGRWRATSEQEPLTEGWRGNQFSPCLQRQTQWKDLGVTGDHRVSQQINAGLCFES
jgi:hypothetical protein